jgi:heme-degrading monooxygenase HmoA
MKYMVVFKAKVHDLDEEYYTTATQLRDKAISQFNCQKFESFCQNQNEIALSYWNSLDDIHAWHIDIEHQNAQQQGKEKWYSHFEIEICEIQRQYHKK